MKSVIYYNNDTFEPIGDTVRASVGKSKTYSNSVKMLHLLTGSGISFIDRTNTLDFGFHYTVLDTIPTYDPTFAQTFSQVANNRAREILDKGIVEVKTIDLFWSGGIDSTTALVAFLNVATPAELNNITVHYNDYSLAEYPGFLETHIAPNFSSVVKFTENIKGNLNINNITVTGELGDQIFGSNLVLTGNPAYIRTRWTDNKDTISPSIDVTYGQNGWQQEIKRILLETHESQRMFINDNWAAFVGWMQPQLNKAPFTISTLFDFLWWINFSMKYQDVTLRIVADQSLTSSSISNLNHFFNSQPFQQWSMQPDNHASKIGATWGSYKNPAKQFILDYTNDINYYNDKVKVGSLKYVRGDGVVSFCALLDTYEQITFGQTNRNWKLFPGKYGNYLDDLF